MFNCLEFYRLYNSTSESADWIELNEQQNFSDRNDNVQIIDRSNYKIGKKQNCKQNDDS